MTGKNRSKILTEVASYYSHKLKLHGQTALGVDWNGEESQKIRFEQLCKIIRGNEKGFTLNDLGCGYGAMFDFLSAKHPIDFYLGIDISEDMIQAAQSRNQANSKVRFLYASEPDIEADYGVASGIFNVRLGRADSEWLDHLVATLDILAKTSRIGFAFNCLSSYADDDKKREQLFYADPCRLFDLCKLRYSRQVALLHDYGLFEFTILIRKV